MCWAIDHGSTKTSLPANRRIPSKPLRSLNRATCISSSTYLTGFLLRETAGNTRSFAFVIYSSGSIGIPSIYHRAPWKHAPTRLTLVYSSRRKEGRSCGGGAARQRPGPNDDRKASGRPTAVGDGQPVVCGRRTLGEVPSPGIVSRI